MPTNRNIQVMGAAGFTPTPAQVTRVQTYLNWMPQNKVPSQIVVVPDDKMGTSSNAMSRVHTNIGYTLAGGNRSYINAKLFDSNDDFVRNETNGEAKYPKGSALEWVLAHEIAHLNTPGNSVGQEKEDYRFNDAANQTIRQWQKDKGPTYSNLEQNVAGQQNQIQPASTPIATQLARPSHYSDNIIHNLQQLPLLLSKKD